MRRSGVRFPSRAPDRRRSVVSPFLKHLCVFLSSIYLPSEFLNCRRVSSGSFKCVQCLSTLYYGVPRLLSSAILGPIVTLRMHGAPILQFAESIIAWLTSNGKRMRNEVDRKHKQNSAPYEFCEHEKLSFHRRNWI
ncbi:MAG: hypothetical protein RL726_1763 [Actinomycetota bacterium]